MHSVATWAGESPCLFTQYQKVAILQRFHVSLLGQDALDCYIQMHLLQQLALHTVKRALPCPARSRDNRKVRRQVLTTFWIPLNLHFRTVIVLRAATVTTCSSDLPDVTCACRSTALGSSRAISSATTITFQTFQYVGSSSVRRTYNSHSTCQHCPGCYC